MAGSALMNLGTRALFASYASLQTTSQNIANAGTAGYSRQTVELQTAGGQFTGAGFFGKGVDVKTVTRAHDDLLTRQAQSSASVASADATRAAQLARLENVFPMGEAGIGHAAGLFLNAFVDVANRPQDLAARQVALARAGDLAARFRSAGQQLDMLQADVTAAVKTAVATVNGLAGRVGDLNGRITLALGSGHAPNDLLDQRDQLVAEISAIVQVTTVRSSNGALNLFVGGGERLVLGEEVSQLAALQDPFDPAQVHVGIRDAAGAHALPDALFTGGSVAGMLRFQSGDLAAARGLLGQLAQSISAAVNGQQALGLDLRQPAGAGAPIFGTGAPRVLPSSGNAQVGGTPVASYLDATGTRVPSVGFVVVDASRLTASDYEVMPDANAPGRYLVTRRSDGQQSSVRPGEVVDGWRLTVGAPAPAPRDRFLVQTVGTAALNMNRVLDDPRAIAAAAPVTASTDVANAGTATVGGVRAVSATLDRTVTTRLAFTSGTGDYAWEQVDGAGAVVGSGTGTWQAGTPIALGGWELSLDGVPASGDRVTVEPTQFPAANNGNARALTDLRDARLVGVGAGSRGASVTDAYADAMTEIGVRVQSARFTAEMSGAVAASAQSELGTKTGVNLDEEAARLIQFQQSYQAAAKMLQVAQSVMDELLKIAAR